MSIVQDFGFVHKIGLLNYDCTTSITGQTTNWIQNGSMQFPYNYFVSYLYLINVSFQPIRQTPKYMRGTNYIFKINRNILNQSSGWKILKITY